MNEIGFTAKVRHFGAGSPVGPSGTRAPGTRSDPVSDSASLRETAVQELAATCTPLRPSTPPPPPASASPATPSANPPPPGGPRRRSTPNPPPPQKGAAAAPP